MFAVLRKIYLEDFEDILPEKLKEIILSEMLYPAQKQYYKYPK